MHYTLYTREGNNRITRCAVKSWPAAAFGNGTGADRMSIAKSQDESASDAAEEWSGSRPSAGGLGRLQLSETVAMNLREQIVSGSLKKGEFLRVDAIAKSLGVSTTPVREGLLLLQSESFVRLIPRRGFMVNSFDKDDLRDLFWAQGVIAGELTARATTRMSKADVNRLQADHIESKAAFVVGDDPSVSRFGHDFHRTISLGARSPRLALLLGSLTKQLPNRFYANIEGTMKDAMEFHGVILEAICAGDAETARAGMFSHIAGVGEHLVAMLERQGMWGGDSTRKPRQPRRRSPKQKWPPAAHR
jgi:DNA-binding GntR family transcriptional regulator